MGSPIRTASSDSTDRGSPQDSSWGIVMAAARSAERFAAADQFSVCALDDDGEFRLVVAGDAEALVAWHPETGWEPVLPADDPRRALLDLYLPICSATAARPITIGHLGQSLDGFIATHAGESQWVTGEENILHLHRLRALCNAVVVGAGTVAADDPLLTTRLVAGPNPLRVVFDPARRLGTHHRVFTDNAADTLYVCGQSLVQPGECRVGRATIVGVDDSSEHGAVSELLQHLHAQGCARVFVEGGGVTVSMFLEANRLDRLHVTIAPLLIGDGRPAIRLIPRAALGDCHRPRYRVFRMGSDMLFDCEFGAPRAAADSLSASPPPISRVI